MKLFAVEGGERGPTNVVPFRWSGDAEFEWIAPVPVLLKALAVSIENDLFDRRTAKKLHALAKEAKAATRGN